MVAAHRGFPFGTVLRVTNLGNDRDVRVRIVDRGPFANGSGAERRVIELSRRAATELGFVDAGTARVRLEVLEWGEGLTGRS
jgi:rare lipoprotein A